MALCKIVDIGDNWSARRLVNFIKRHSQKNVGYVPREHWMFNREDDVAEARRAAMHAANVAWQHAGNVKPLTYYGYVPD